MASATPDLVHSYLQEIGRYPLLTQSLEIAYARQVQQMIAIEQTIEQQTQQLHRKPTPKELAKTVQKTEAQVLEILNLGQRAKQKMITANLRLVVSIAKKHQNRNLEFPDLIQEGALGLQRSIEKFDPNRGYSIAHPSQRKTQSDQEARARTISITGSSSYCGRNCRVLETQAFFNSGISECLETSRFFRDASRKRTRN